VLIFLPGFKLMKQAEIIISPPLIKIHPLMIEQDHEESLFLHHRPTPLWMSVNEEF
jgi:hypothetical protein